MPEQKKDNRSTAQKAIDLLKVLSAGGTAAYYGGAAVSGIAKNAQASKIVKDEMGFERKTVKDKTTGKNVRKIVDIDPNVDPKTGKKLPITSPVRAQQNVDAVKRAKSNLKWTANWAVDQAIERELEAAKGGKGRLAKFGNAVQNVKTNLGVGSTAAGIPATNSRPGKPNMSFKEVRRPLRQPTLDNFKGQLDAATNKRDLVRTTKDIMAHAKGNRLGFMGKELSPGLTKAIQAGGKVTKYGAPALALGSFGVDAWSRMDAARKADAAPSGPAGGGTSGGSSGGGGKQAADPNKAFHDEIATLWNSVNDEAFSRAQRGQLGGTNVTGTAKVLMKSRIEDLSPEAQNLFKTDARYSKAR
jgi:hypothetical protein